MNKTISQIIYLKLKNILITCFIKKKSASSYPIVSNFYNKSVTYYKCKQVCV
jgi:hypothetical protein